MRLKLTFYSENKKKLMRQNIPHGNQSFKKLLNDNVDCQPVEIHANCHGQYAEASCLMLLKSCIKHVIKMKCGSGLRDTCIQNEPMKFQ